MKTKVLFGHHFLNLAQSWFDAVAMECTVGECRSNDVFAEAHGLDAQLHQMVEDWAGLEAVAFELHDDDVSHVFVLSVADVVKLEVEIDGEALCLQFVDQRDAVEVVFHFLGEKCGLVS